MPQPFIISTEPMTANHKGPDEGNKKYPFERVVKKNIIKKQLPIKITVLRKTTRGAPINSKFKFLSLINWSF